MAHIDNIWLHASNKEACTIRAYVKLKPTGEVNIDVPIPKNFMTVLLEIAQLAADAHEAQMRAEILGDQHKLTAIPAQEQTGEGK